MPCRLKPDRLALCGYLISGELLGGELGSVVMFDVPRAYGERALDENFLQVGCH